MTGPAHDPPGATADGTPVALLAAVASPAEAARAAGAGAEGVGPLALEALTAPGPPAAPGAAGAGERSPDAALEEACAALLHACGRTPVLLRTAAPPTTQEPAPHRGNPRAAALAALARAAARTGARPWVLTPLVSGPAEAEEAVAAAHTAGLDVAGVLVDVPALALRAHHVVPHVDLAWVDADALARAVLVADLRGRAADAWHPAVLDLISLVTAAAGEHARPVGLCGAAVADPLLALVLVGLGASGLSVPPGVRPGVHRALAHTPVALCRAMADAALQSRDAAEARVLVAAMADPAALGR